MVDSESTNNFYLEVNLQFTQFSLITRSDLIFLLLGRRNFSAKMLPLRLFLIMGISMIFSSAVFGGESPNNRIDTLLSLMTGMSERVDKLVKNVRNMETEVAEVKKNADWTFVGMGWFVKHDENYDVGLGLTVAGCLSVCTDKRSRESSRWNGVLFDPSEGWCSCIKNDVGHDPTIVKDAMHFKG